jgi:hypothetical protein
MEKTRIYTRRAVNWQPGVYFSGRRNVDWVQGTPINCLRPLLGLKYTATRRESKQNGYSILEAHYTVDVCFGPSPPGRYVQPRLGVALFRQAISLALKARFDSELGATPEVTSN